MTSAATRVSTPWSKNSKTQSLNDRRFMKRCPECRRNYYDDSLLYCLDDGAALLEGPSTADHEAITVPNRPPGTAGLRPVNGLRTDHPTEVLQASLRGSFGFINSIAVLPFANLSKNSD